VAPILTVFQTNASNGTLHCRTAATPEQPEMPSVLLYVKLEILAAALSATSAYSSNMPVGSDRSKVDILAKGG